MSCAFCPCEGCFAERARRRERGRQLENLERLLPYLLDVPKIKCPMIRLLDDPAWRESLKVAETPVEAEYAGVRERLEAMRPAPAGFYSERTGYENEYRQFFGFRS